MYINHFVKKIVFYFQAFSFKRGGLSFWLSHLDSTKSTPCRSPLILQGRKKNIVIFVTICLNICPTLG